MIHDRRDYATEITEVEFAALESHDLHTGVAQLFPMHHRIEDVSRERPVRQRKSHRSQPGPHDARRGRKTLAKMPENRPRRDTGTLARSR